MYNLIKDRVEAEEEYAKKLSKIAKMSEDEEGFGMKVSEDALQTSLTSAWKQVCFFLFQFLLLVYFTLKSIFKNL